MAGRVKVKGYPVKRVVLYVKKELERSGRIESLVRVLEARFEIVSGQLGDELEFGEDVIISVGGDGTFIAAARSFNPEIPILGVNMGRRGAMTDALPSDLPIVVERLNSGEYYIEERLRLQVSSREGALSSLVINEVYVNRTYKGVTPAYTISIDGFRIYSERMDGVIVSTPTGSTGYSLSAGGPVLKESMEAVVITPVLPIKRVPPVVAPITKETTIEVESTHRIQVVLDGQIYEAPREDSREVIVKRSSTPLRIVRLTDEPFQHLRKTL